jgi:hypothetical protein
MTTSEAGATRRALAAGMMRLVGLSAGYGETNKYAPESGMDGSPSCTS